MHEGFDIVIFVSLLLCIVILALGDMGYRKTKNPIPLYIGIAFGIFGASHLFDMIGLEITFFPLRLLLNSVGYLLVIFALYRYLR